jgi:O-antigen/teichoic acid export membrane protein
VILVPNAAKARHDVRERARVLRISAALVLLTTLLVVIPAAVAPHFVMTTMFGSEYGDASDGALPIALAGAGLSLLYLLVVFAVTIEDRRWTLVLLAGIAAQMIGIGLFHDSPAQVATVQAVVVAIVLLVNEVLFHSLLRLPKTEPETATR